MRLCFRLSAICTLLLSSIVSQAIQLSYRNAHPIGWMHLLPVGETPGWSTSAWTDIEFNHANIWNMQSDMIDSRTGDVYTYKADFEQSSLTFNMGFALGSKLALSFELPYANRNGGFLDDFIDQFHQNIQSDRFFRHLNEDFGNSFVVQVNGEDRLVTQKAEGLGGAKVKLKWWMWQWKGPTPGVCDCGFALSAQAKFPTQARKFGLSSGNNDYSGLAHLGAPLGKYSAVWTTAAVTRLGPNDTFGGWPRRDWLQMYELSLDLGVGPHFGLLAQARTESPLFMQEHLDFQYTQATEDGRRAERIASGWNALTSWRGSQFLALRWKWGQGNEANFGILEDWGTGRRDGRSDLLYVNNAPDVAFLSQWHFSF